MIDGAVEIVETPYSREKENPRLKVKQAGEEVLVDG